MVAADNHLFEGLSSYFLGLSKLSLAQLAPDEPAALRDMSSIFESACTSLRAVCELETELLIIAQGIDYSAYFSRRHEVASALTAEVLRGLEMMAQDTSDGYHPAKACTVMNVAMTQLMASIEQNARIERVLTRFEDRRSLVGNQAT